MAPKKSFWDLFTPKNKHSSANEPDALETTNSSNEQSEFSDYKIWECTVCGFIYDEYSGCPEEGLSPGTRWEDVPYDWSCPDCGVTKEYFGMIERSRLTTAQKKQLDAV